MYIVQPKLGAPPFINIVLASMVKANGKSLSAGIEEAMRARKAHADMESEQ